MQGFSLAMESAALASVPVASRAAVTRLCNSVRDGAAQDSLWIIGGRESGKTALSAYLAQQLMPDGLASVHRLGDLLAELRWIAATGGQGDLEIRLAEITTTPLLVIDDFDRPARSAFVSGLTFEGSCTRHDLLALAQIVRERRDALLPTVVTTRSGPAECLDRVTAISRRDLVRGLVSSISLQGDPIEDFPRYSLGILGDAIEGLRKESIICDLHDRGLLAVAA